MHWLNATTMASLVSKMGPLSVLHLLFLFSINIIIDPYVHNTFQYKHFMFDFPISKVLRIWLSGDICYLIAHFSLSLKTLLPDCIFSPRHCSLPPPPWNFCHLHSSPNNSSLCIFQSLQMQGLLLPTFAIAATPHPVILRVACWKFYVPWPFSTNDQPFSFFLYG